MKRTFVILLFLGLIFISCKKHRFSDTHWIAVDSTPIPPDSGHGVYDGLTIHFKKNKAILDNVYEKDNREYFIKVDKNKIFLNDTLLGTIITEYQDSIIIDIRESARVRFVKLDKQHAIEEKEQLWKHKDWILSYNGYERILFLTNTIFSNRNDTKICFEKSITNNTMSDEFEIWKTITINENQLFVKTLNQTDSELYRIKSYEGDSMMQLQYIKYPDVPVTMTKRPYVSDSKKQKIAEKIQDTHWKIKKIIQLDTLLRNYRVLPEKIEFTTLIDKKVSFRFSKNSTYEIYESDTIVSKGTWQLSPTGKEIILNKGVSPTDYISLIEVHSDSITIGHLEEFRALDEYATLNIQETYYVAKLEK
ncbi:hypothetical protein [uncultured Dokdonia sp.]|uniref:hypothetical protein n=1 Tax=uncultured Dokdonia sp. TaxID=575653 RepID=UPI00261FB05A|nr:hypothetical protein [uncultured Dokdonia sp.]